MKKHLGKSWILAATAAAGLFTATAVADNRVGHRLTDFDVNSDGTITKEEFVAASADLVKELQADFLEKYDSIPTGQTTGDGIIKPDEILAVAQEKATDWLEHVLDVFDSNDDGVISDADKTRSGRRGAFRHLLSELDTDDDGIISSKELTTAAAEKATHLQAAFLKKYDSVPTGQTTGDGTITPEEYLAVFQDRVQDRVENILEKFDANGDGSVTAAEVADVLKPKTNPGRGRGPRR